MAVVALHRRDPLDVHHSLLTLARAGIALARRRERPSPQVRHRLRAVTAWCVLAEPAFLAAAGAYLAALGVLRERTGHDRRSGSFGGDSGSRGNRY
jgi:hypothetical protein